MYYVPVCCIIQCECKSIIIIIAFIILSCPLNIKNNFLIILTCPYNSCARIDTFDFLNIYGIFCFRPFCFNNIYLLFIFCKFYNNFFEYYFSFFGNDPIYSSFLILLRCNSTVSSIIQPILYVIQSLHPADMFVMTIYI